MYAEFQKTGKVVKTLPDMTRRSASCMRTGAACAAETARCAGARAACSARVKPLDEAPVIKSEKAGTETGSKAETRACARGQSRCEARPKAGAPACTGPRKRPSPEAVSVSEAEPESAPRRIHWRSRCPDAGIAGRGCTVRWPQDGRDVLEKLGIMNVGDLLDCDIDETVHLLNARHIDAEALTDWQDQSRLMMDVPGLRVHDTQILVGAGIRNAADLAAALGRDVFLSAMDFLTTPQGDRVLWEDAEFEETGSRRLDQHGAGERCLIRARVATGRPRDRSRRLRPCFPTASRPPVSACVRRASTSRT